MDMVSRLKKGRDIFSMGSPIFAASDVAVWRGVAL